MSAAVGGSRSGDLWPSLQGEGCAHEDRPVGCNLQGEEFVQSPASGSSVARASVGRPSAMISRIQPIGPLPTLPPSRGPPRRFHRTVRRSLPAGHPASAIGRPRGSLRHQGRPVLRQRKLGTLQGQTLRREVDSAAQMAVPFLAPYLHPPALHLHSSIHQPAGRDRSTGRSWPRP